MPRGRIHEADRDELLLLVYCILRWQSLSWMQAAQCLPGRMLRVCRDRGHDVSGESSGRVKLGFDD